MIDIYELKTIQVAGETKWHLAGRETSSLMRWRLQAGPDIPLSRNLVPLRSRGRQSEHIPVTGAPPTRIQCADVAVVIQVQTTTAPSSKSEKGAVVVPPRMTICSLRP